MNYKDTNIEDFEIVKMFFGGEFTAYKLESALFEDSSCFEEDFFAQFLQDKRLEEWVEETGCRGIMGHLFKCSFMFGGCDAFNENNLGNDPLDNVNNRSAKFRPRLFAQSVRPNKDLVEWIDKTGCLDLIYSLYENAFVCGAHFVVSVLNQLPFSFEKKDE